MYIAHTLDSIILYHIYIVLCYMYIAHTLYYSTLYGIYIVLKYTYIPHILYDIILCDIYTELKYTYILHQCACERDSPGEVSYLLCSLIKNREEEDPPWRTTPKIDQSWGWFFRGGPLPPSSWSGITVNMKSPRGEVFFSDQLPNKVLCTTSSELKG